ncbi:MAG: DUF5686 family protein [Paludibacteraceae bacterium]|nr:DUF5686 family protein [Paludibacteraceae bacterium]
MCISSISIYAETYTGLVTDSITGEILPFISIQIEGTMFGDETDIDGNFTIKAEPSQKLIFTFLGYNTKTIALRNYPMGKKINVKLRPTDYQLAEVQVTAKNSYSKKNNPAVDLIKRIISEKKENTLENCKYYQRDAYEKMVTGFTDFSEKISNTLGINDITKQSDTSIVSGKTTLLMTLKEKSMTQYYRQNPKTHKQIVKGKSSQGIDDEIFGEDWLNSYLTELFKDVDIYSGSIMIGFKPFVGPLSSMAPDFYKFFIKDTIAVDSTKYIRLGFTPFNSANYGFMGFITVDSATLAIKNVSIDVPKKTNINFIDGLHIEQNFNKNDKGIMELTDDRLVSELAVIQGTQSVYVERKRTFSNYIFNEPNDSILRSFSGEELVLRDAETRDSTFWQSQRSDSLSFNESKMAALITKLQKNPVVKGIMWIAETLIKGYIRTDKVSKFDIGPVYSMFSTSAVEGFRLKVCGETTANLFPNFFASGYMAMGFGDNRIKYGGTLEYSFNEKKYHPREFPVHSLALSGEDDIKTIGEQPAGTLADNLFYSIKRMAVRTVMYYKKGKLTYTFESRSGFSVQPWIHYEIDESAGILSFKRPIAYKPGEFENLQYLHNNELGIKLRFAPKEKIVQGRIYRFNLKNPHPVFELTHKASFPGILNCEYGYQTTELKYLQRFFLNAYGRIDLLVKAGKVWTGNVPYPYLMMPNANTSFTIMEESFSQVNPLEFVADNYASLDISINTNLLFNSIPGVKKLLLREVVGFKLYWGHLSNKNNPAYNSNLLLFPEGTYAMDWHEPYMEFSVGIDNILKVLRIDYVRRINYLNHPNIWANGVRVSLNFQF